MPLIVVMEDEDSTRMLLSALLKKKGYDVMAVDNGAEGLELVTLHKPDLVLSDVNMPGLNGLQMLSLLRKQPAICTTPVILLTSIQERTVMRAGMNTGADDYITKPFKPAEVYEAVAAQLNKRNLQQMMADTDKHEAIKAALETQKHNLVSLYKKRLEDNSSAQRPEAEPDDDHIFKNAAVLYVNAANFSALSHQLSSEELTALINKFYANAGDTMHVFGASITEFVRAGLLAVFASEDSSQVINHDLRAVRAANGMLGAALGMRHYLQTTYPGRNLPEFVVQAAVTSGPVTLAVMQNPKNRLEPRVVPVGAAVNQCIALQSQVVDLGWSMAVSAATLAAIESQGGVKVGRRTSVALGSNAPSVDVIEFLGLTPSV